ncbi:hypothetical protein C4K20_2304 [Pseudomonas chlororaphis subsp. aurantiaca]|nr:hypothetical protein C4K20_2304 [Pseudomonas chlororaphis subsp. aurantiaca]AZD66157.1 hypothetical protein C4K17_2271 [Pseudomonas chlororaphis subsp. aurantiaca]AZD72633.1 hypothetical protein C4K16_2273 [Pseudomonas chlororaphis subsp. aurantiaca]
MKTGFGGAGTCAQQRIGAARNLLRTLGDRILVLNARH